MAASRKRENMVQHKLSLKSLLEGAPVVLPFELTMSLKPGFGVYSTCDGSGAGVTLTVSRDGRSASSHYPNRYQAWARVQAIQARYMGGVAS